MAKTFEGPTRRAILRRRRAAFFWFLTEINTQTRILTFRNSAGTLGHHL
jgi:hypothetical protein